MRPPRFRLSTLMLLIVIAALATALVVQQARLARDRMRAEMAARDAAARTASLAAPPAPAPAPPNPAGGVQ